MFRIGTFSKLGKTTVKALRHYDEIGLLAPARIDPENGYRYYTTEQLLQLHRIVALRQTGFSLPEIRSMLDGQGTLAILEARRGQLAAELKAASDRLSRIDSFIEEQREGTIMDYLAQIKEIPEYTVFSMRKTIPDYMALGQLMQEAGAAVAAANPGIKCVEPEYCVTIYHDGEYRERDIDAEVCQAVELDGPEAGVAGAGFEFKLLPAATVASVLHRGPYGDLGAAYAYVYKWVEDNGYAPCGLPRESYIDGVWNKDDEADWLTEVQVPVAK